MVEVLLVLIHRIGILAADLPEERMEGVFVAILLEVVKQANFLAIRRKVGPDVPVDRNDHLAAQVFRHAQHVG